MGTVLLVEDDEAVRKVLRHMLGRMGYTVLEAPDVSAALTLAGKHRHPLDLLVTDVVMPLDGCDRLVRELSSHRPNLKVIYISGYSQEMLSRYGVTESDVNFIQKPFTADTLARKIRQVLETPRAKRAGAGSDEAR